MGSRHFTVLIVIRVLLLIATIFLITRIFGDPRLFFNQIIVCLIIILQILELIRFVNHTNRELSRFLLSIKHGDFSATFKQRPLNNAFKDLQNSMSEIIDSYKQVKIEKEAQYHFLQMLVNQIRVGIISIVNDDIILINPTAERLLHIEGLKNWKLIQQLNPWIAKEFAELGDNGRKLIETKVAGETKVLSVDVTTRVLLDRQTSLITLQDINSEIEQKEIEAWHKLIRILTHEIMNSITPISSLTETMQSMLTDREGKQKALEAISEETITDIRFSLNTIQNRSEGLMHFVENYRKLTRVPKPVLEKVDVPTFISSFAILLKGSLERQGITLITSIGSESMNVSFDPSLMEQVIINLITNSTHALENRNDKRIDLKAYQTEHHVTLEVTDNGKGIPEKELKEIFIPFFSTKKEGSGIGLSLSKQIISQHGGTIKVTSVLERGTSFLIQLPKNDSKSN